MNLFSKVVYFFCLHTRGTRMLQEPDAYNGWNVGSLAGGRASVTDSRRSHGRWVANVAAVASLLHVQTTL